MFYFILLYFIASIMMWQGGMSVKQLEFKTVKLEVNKSLNFNDLNIEFQNFWKSLSEQNNHIYDGELVTLHNCVIEPEKIILEVFSLKFSEFLYLKKHEMLDRLAILGSLGAKLHLYDKSKKFVLIGKRSDIVTNEPNSISTVGGMIEHKDLDYSIREFLYKELEEETDLIREEIEHNSIYLRAIIPEYENKSVNLIFNLNTKYPVNKPVEVSSNKEWYNLKWELVSEVSTKILNNTYTLDLSLIK
jgi:hypothetical protein